MQEKFTELWIWTHFFQANGIHKHDMIHINSQTITLKKVYPHFLFIVLTLVSCWSIFTHIIQGYFTGTAHCSNLEE